VKAIIGIAELMNACSRYMIPFTAAMTSCRLSCYRSSKWFTV